MSIILRICLVVFLFFITGCSWIALLDASDSSKDYGCSKKLNAEIDYEAKVMDMQFKGFSRDQVIAKLGKRRKVKHESYSYIIDENCFGNSCETRAADEAWFYEFKKKISGCGSYVYSVIVYFVNGKVVAVR